MQKMLIVKLQIICDSQLIKIDKSLSLICTQHIQIIMKN